MTAAVLVTSSDGDPVTVVTVGSFTVLPSVSSPSSPISVTSFVFPGLEAVAEPVLDIPPASTAACSII